MAPSHGRWMRLRRWLRRLLAAVAGLLVLALLLAVALAGSILFTETGTARVLDEALRRYDDMVPGGIELRARRGVLGGRLELEGLRLTDRVGRELLAVDLLVLDWQPSVLLQGELRVAELAVVRPTVRLWQGVQPNPLLDLAPPPSPGATPEPEAPSEPFELPELPLGLGVLFRLQRLRVVQHAAPTPPYPKTSDPPATDAGGGQELLRGLDLTVDVGGGGPGAQVVVRRGAVEIPAADLQVSRLRCTLRRAGSRLAVEDLEVHTNRGAFVLPAATWSLDSGRGELLAQVDVPAAALQGLAGVPVVAGLRLRARAAGTLQGVVLQASIDLPRDVGGSAGQIEARLQADLLPHPAVELEVLLAGLAPEAFGAPAGVSLGGDLRLRAALPGLTLATVADGTLADLCADLRLRCRGCRVPRAGPVRGTVVAQVLAGGGEAHVSGRAVGVVLGVKALLADLDGLRAPDAAPQDLQLRLDIPDLGASAAVVGLDEVRGRLAARGRCSGRVLELRCAADVSVDDAAGFGASLRRARLVAEARPMAQPPKVRATVTLEGIQAPGLPGQLAGELRVKGDAGRVHLTLDGHRAANETLSLAAVIQPGPPVTVELSRLHALALGEHVRLLGPVVIRRIGERVELGPLRLAALGARLRAEGSFDPAGVSDLRASVKGLDLLRVRRLEPRLKATGVLALQARLRGRLASPRAELTLTGQDLAWDELGLGALEVTAGYSAGRGRGAVSLGGAPGGPRIQGSASLPLLVDLTQGRVAPNLRGHHELSWTLSDLDSAWVATLQPLPAGAAFLLASRGTLRGPALALVGDAELSGPVTPPGFQASELHAALRLAPGRQDVEVRLELPRPLEGDLAPLGGTAATPAAPPLAEQPLLVRVQAQADLSGLPERPPDPLDVPFVAQVVVPAVDLAGLAALLPDALFDPVGRLSATIDASGTGRAPTLKGQVELKGGGISVVPMGGRITDATLDLGLAHTGVELRRLDFRSGKGRGSIHGTVALTPEGAASGRIDVHLEKLPILAPGAPRARLDSRVRVDLSRAAADGALAVDVQVRETTVHVTARRSRALDSIPHNSHIVFIDPAAQEAAAAPAVSAGSGAGVAGPPATLQVRLVDPVILRAPFLDMRWGGTLEAAHRQGRLTVSGGLVSERSAFNLIGNRFEVESGEVSIAEGERVEPYLRLVAHADTAEARVTATIRGPASAPELLLSSEPPLPQYQILTLLVTGSTQSSEEGGDQVRSKAAALLAAFQSPELERQLHDRVGIDRARITFGESTDQPILVLGKFLTRWMYLETRYHHNAPVDVNARELRLELRLGRRWSLESLYGDAAVGGLDLYWRPPIERLGEAKSD